MVTVVETILGRVRDEALLIAGRPVIVMLSGGRDSTCLLDVAVQISGAAWPRCTSATACATVPARMSATAAICAHGSASS